MAGRSLEAKLAALRDDPGREEVLAALRGNIGVIVAAALSHAEAHRLADELAPAFGRLCEQGAKRDPGCRGKVAIADAIRTAATARDAQLRGEILRTIRP